MKVVVARQVTDEERRARAGVRHALAPAARVVTPEDAARAVVCLHATDPPSVHLSCWARTNDVTVRDIERTLYDTRTLVRQQAMRETLFVFPRELVPAVWASASARIAAVHRKRLVKDLERWGPATAGHGARWLRDAERAVLDCLSDGRPRASTEIRQEVPEADGVIVQAPDKSWGGKVAIAPKVLMQLSMEGLVARAANAGPWYTSRPTWTTVENWWGRSMPDPVDANRGYAEIISRWLWAYGPGTVEDIAWWLGSTKTTVRTALDDIGAQPVGLRNGSIGWLHPDDLDQVTTPGQWVALLPLLDPTVMGWKDRDFLLGPHGPQLFDSIGNAGTTALVDGRAVGAWVQDTEGVVRLRLLETITREQQAALEAEAERLTGWLDGQRVFTVYPSPAMQHTVR